jgi:biotin transport system substrate-specific component
MQAGIPERLTFPSVLARLVLNQATGGSSARAAGIHVRILFQDGSSAMSNPNNLVLDTPVEKPVRGVLAQALWVMSFALASALAARFEIPHNPVPYTLQTMVVLLAGAFLGARNGALSQLVYLGAGALGAPVFAGGAFGFARILGPSGGYLLAFPLAAAIVGYVLRDSRATLRIVIAMTSAMAVIFAAGTAHLYAFYIHNAWTAVTSGFLIFSWWDLIKISAAVMVYREVGKRWPRLP